LKKIELKIEIIIVSQFYTKVSFNSQVTREKYVAKRRVVDKVGPNQAEREYAEVKTKATASVADVAAKTDVRPKLQPALPMSRRKQT
jgi:hypothetical protein